MCRCSTRVLTLHRVGEGGLGGAVESSRPALLSACAAPRRRFFTARGPSRSPRPTVT